MSSKPEQVLRGSGGEKEIIASYVLTASLSYALCPDGSSRPLFGTIVLDEAFRAAPHAVAGRIIAALREFGLHAVFITPNKEMRLLRHHTRSAVVVHRRGGIQSGFLSWEALMSIINSASRPCMKSPTDIISRSLAKQWQRSSVRLERLLNPGSWPQCFNIGKPSARVFAENIHAVLQHVENWRSVKVGKVDWESVSYRAGLAPLLADALALA